MAKSLLELTGITVRFGGVVANDAVDVSVEPSSIVGIIGPNGAGKSTLLNAASGFVKPRSGSVILDGRRIDRLAPDARSRLGLGRTFQVPRLFRAMTVNDNVDVARRQVSTDRHHGVANPLAVCGVEHLGEERVDRLDAGDQRFVELARSLATRPRVLLLDEPATGLREHEIDRLAALLHELAASGISTLLISHDMRLVHATCGHVVMLDFGRVLTEGTAAEVCADDRVIDAYLGRTDSQ
jgi:branched-chain amino acid transport system ATP-binding protein